MMNISALKIIENLNGSVYICVGYNLSDMAKREIKVSLHTETDFNEIIEDFKNESDRATVILAAAKIDAQLYILLSKVLKPSNSNQDELLDGDNPLGTFSSRINIAFRLGLIDAQFAKALHLIRKIRNSFAHEIKGNSLVSGGHADRVKELVIHFKDYEQYQQSKEQYFPDKDGLDIDFRMIVAIAIIRVDTAIHYSNQIEDEGTALRPPSWTKIIEEEQDNNKIENADK